MTRRIERVNSVIRQELGELLQRQVKDPRLGSFISVTDISTSPDLSYAKIFVSCIGGEVDKKEIMKALTSASGFLRNELAKRLSLRRVPELDFEWDSSIEHGDRILRLLNEVSAEGDSK